MKSVCNKIPSELNSGGIFFDTPESCSPGQNIISSFTIYYGIIPHINKKKNLLYVVTKRLTQWGSKSLGEQGFSPIEILRYYYGDDMYINTAEAISGIPSSWPGYTLEQGSQGPKVRQIQEELNVIAGAYPEIPKLTEDGIYGSETEAAVRKFQSIFGLPVTGEIDYKTWYKISEIYVGVSRIAELS